MYTIDYEIKELSCIELNNLNHAIANIRNKRLTDYWECQQILDKVDLTLSFDRSTITQIIIQNKSCTSIRVSLFNLSEVNKPLNEKSLEKISFHGQENERIINVCTEQPYTFINLEIMNSNPIQNKNKLALYYVEIKGRPMMITAKKQATNNIDYAQKNLTIESQMDKKNILYQRNGSPQKNVLNVTPNSRIQKLLGQQNSSAKLISPYRKHEVPNFLIDELRIQKEKQISNVNSIHKKATRQKSQSPEPIDNENSVTFNDLMQVAIRMSLETQNEDQKQQTIKKQKNLSAQIVHDINDLIQLIPSQDDKKKVKMEQERSQQKELIFLEVTSPQTQQWEELNFEEMFDVNENMIQDTFLNNQSIYEMSRQIEDNQFTTYLRKNYKPLVTIYINLSAQRGLKYYIPQNVDHRQSLIQEANKLGAIQMQNLSQDVMLIIIDDIKQFDISKINKQTCAIVKSTFISECDGKKFPILKNYQL